MFSNALIAFLIAAGLGTWIYNKLQHQVGNKQNALIGAAVSGGIIFLVVITLLGMLIKN